MELIKDYPSHLILPLSGGQEYTHYSSLVLFSIRELDAAWQNTHIFQTPLHSLQRCCYTSLPKYIAPEPQTRLRHVRAPAARRAAELVPVN